MAILNFVKPDQVVMINSTETEGQFEFRPLEPGFGITIGNSLRRILLSSLEGHAITSVRIEGVDHEFSTIKGVVEDVTEIILNLKQVRFKKQLDNHDVEKIVIHFAGNEKFTAGEIGKFANGFQILNPDLVIFNCESNVKLKIELLDGRVCYETEKDEIERLVIAKSEKESGIHEALLLMRKGDKAKLILPSYLGHGLLGDRMKIPPQSALYIDLQLIDIK